jgi:hypothetical protein
MRRFQITTVLMLGTLAMFLTGCSRNPVAPDVTMPARGAEMMGTQTNDQPAEVEGGTPMAVTATLQATDGARLTVGRFTLELHKNSLRMPATITLRVPSEDATEVVMEVVPAEAADLKVPAELSANMSDLPGTNYATIWMWYYENGLWEEYEDVAPQEMRQNVVARMDVLSNCLVADHVPAEDIRQKK